MPDPNPPYPLSDAELFWVVRWEDEGSISVEERARLNVTHPDRVQRFQESMRAAKRARQAAA